MKNEARLKLFWRGYVCISSRGPLPPLDLELYSRASQESYRGGFRIQERRGRAAGRGHGSSQPAYECDRSQVYRDHPVGHH